MNATSCPSRFARSRCAPPVPARCQGRPASTLRSHASRFPRSPATSPVRYLPFDLGSANGEPGAEPSRREGRWLPAGRRRLHKALQVPCARVSGALGAGRLTTAIGALVAVLSAVAAVGAPVTAAPLAGTPLVVLSGRSPFADRCGTGEATQAGAEVEAHLAVDPSDAAKL